MTPEKEADGASTPKPPPAPDWDKFLTTLRTIPNVARACQEAGVSRAAAYQRRKRSKTFAAAWDAALLEGVERAEGESWRRAVEGVPKPVYQGGKRVGMVQEYSDTLLIFMLKAHKRSLYGDKAVTVEQLRDYAERLADLVLTYVPEEQREQCKRDILGLPLLG